MLHLFIKLGCPFRKPCGISLHNQAEATLHQLPQAVDQSRQRGARLKQHSREQGAQCACSRERGETLSDFLPALRMKLIQIQQSLPIIDVHGSSESTCPDCCHNFY